MTSSGSTRPEHGTRFSFELRSSDESSAVYDCTIFRAEVEWRVVLQLDAASAQVLSQDESTDPAALAQLIALGKTLKKHSDDGTWPRRILRWRQPGVR